MHDVKKDFWCLWLKRILSHVSPRQKQFLTSLLHESLAQEDHAIDHFDGPYYTTTSTGSPSTVSTQSVKSSPFSSISSPASTLPPSSPEETEFKVLLPPPPPPPDQPDSSNQPLDFTQVFGKLQPGFQNPSDILSRALVNELLSNGCADKQRTQLVDEKLIKIDQGIHTNTKLPEQIQADFTSQSSSAFDTHFSTVISNSCDALPSSSPAISVAPVVSHVDPLVILSQAVSLQKVVLHKYQFQYKQNSKYIFFPIFMLSRADIFFHCHQKYSLFCFHFCLYRFDLFSTIGAKSEFELFIN